jgi:hypothetical protein
MKTIREISKILNVSYELVFRSVYTLEIEPAKRYCRKRLFDEYQIELIIDFLHYTGKLQYLIFESKMNNQDFESYSRKEMIQKGLIKIN